MLFFLEKVSSSIWQCISYGMISYKYDTNVALLNNSLISQLVVVQPVSHEDGAGLGEDYRSLKIKTNYGWCLGINGGGGGVVM